MTQMTGESVIQVGEDPIVIYPVHEAAGAMVRFLLKPSSEGAQNLKEDTYKVLSAGEIVLATDLATDVYATYRELRGGNL